MKKTLILSAVLFAAFGMNAEVVDYDFNNNPPMFKLLPLPEDEGGRGWSGNYDLVNKYGKTANEPNGAVEDMIYMPEGATKGIARANRIISLADGCTYLLQEEENDLGLTVATEEILNQPYLTWGEKGITRTIWMTGWGSDDAWADGDYNAAKEEDWVASKNGIQFSRLGTLDMVSRGDTWIQFPAIQGPVKVTVWAAPHYDKNNTQNLMVRVTPVVDGVAGEKVILFDKAVTTDKANTDPALVINKRYYKAEHTFDATGKVAIQVGPENNQLNLMHVRIESAASESAIENIIADAENENAPVYNLLGVQVDETYKGVVIKNGKKYIQK